MQLFVLAACFWLVVTARLMRGQEVDDSFYAAPGVLDSQILRARGYLVEEKYFTTTDNYVIRLTRANNPLINGGRPGGLLNRTPILFIHGILESSNVFVINSFGAQPKDLSRLQLDNETVAKQVARDEPSAKSLALLALNFGHEIWIMSRRGFPGSQELVGDPASIPASEADGDAVPPLKMATFQERDRQLISPPPGPFTSALSALLGYGSLLQQVPFSFDAKFWNFSFDEQARYDFAQAINFVLAQTGRERVSVVSHSAGGAIELMALSLYPSLADKIESSILWSQGFSLGHGDGFNILQTALPLLERYVGSVPPAFSTTQIQALAGLFCTTPLVQRTLCEGVADLILGYSAGQQPLRPEFINSLLYPTASHELAQNLQMVPYGQVRVYNYGPFYNASNIRLKTMSFWVGATDRTVSPADVRATLPLLRVPYKFHLIDTAFNHNGYFYHTNNARLVIVPSLREIHQFAAQSSA